MSFLSVEELKTFKKMTGGDSLFAELKGQQAFEFTYNGLLWFCMNQLPKFGGNDGKWVYDRIMVVECKNVIPKEETDKELLDKMYAERDGIVYKAVRALQTVIANGYRFSEPVSVTEAREKYQTENNTVIRFFEHCMGHSDISVTMNVHTHIGLDDAEEELKRMEEFRKAQAEIEKKNEKPMSQKMFKVV